MRAVASVVRASGVRSVDNYTPTAPTTAARGLDFGQHLRRAARNRYFLQFAVSKKGYVRAVGRPKGKARAFSSL